jgi:PAS domain S-box-containing protein
MEDAIASDRWLAESSRRGRVWDYGIASLAGLLALLVGAATAPVTPAVPTYVLSLLAVVFVACQCGFGPAIVTLAISLIGTVFFFISPRYQFAIEAAGDQLSTAVFVICGVCCAALGRVQQASRAEARSALSNALDRKAELEAEVSRREKVEDSLRQSEATLRAFYDSAPVCMGIVELLEEDVRHLYDNSAGCRFYGTEPGATVGRLESELGTPPEILRLWQSKYRESEEKRSAIRFEYDYEIAAGQRWLMATVRPIGMSAADRRLFCYVAEDVTGRRQAEDAVRESQLRFRSMADGVPGLIWLSNADRKRTYFNRTWLQFTGRTIEQELGDGWIENLHPDDREMYLTAYSSAFETRKPFELEYRLRRHDGVYRWVFACGTPRFHPSGGFAGFVGFCLDVTDRRIAVEAIRRNELRFRTLTEAIPQIVWNAGSDGAVSYFNQRWKDFTGFSTEESQGAGWLDAVHPNDRDRMLEAWQSTVASASSAALVQFNEELRLRHGQTGEFRWFLAIAVPLYSQDGSVDQWIGSMADIHDQKTASAVIAESEEKFRTMAESIPQLAWMTDADGYIFWYNQRWYEFTGTSFEEMKGWGWQQVHDPADLPRVVERFKSHITSGEPWEDIFLLRRHDGVMRWHLSRARPIRDKSGRIVRWFGTNTDITDQREMEQRLRAAAERFRTLTEAVPQIVWTANSKGEVTFFNRRWHEYTGLPAENMTTVTWGNAIHPHDAEPLQSGWQFAISGEAEPFTCEFRLRRNSDGGYRWMLSTAVPLRDSFGAVTEWVGSLTDIDDQKRQSETLERMVQDRTTALVAEIQDRTRAEQHALAVAVELERSNKELQEFAYVASHDLQEPLRKIQAFGDRLRKRFRDELPEMGREYVDRMSESASRMRRLIDDLLNYSRVTTQALPFSQVEMGALVREVISDLDELIAQTNARIHCGPIPNVAADPTQMRQLFQNLIANAVKFHRPEVPPVVEIASELVDVKLPGNPLDAVAGCRIEIRDNGIGFDEKHLGRIFQVFQRLRGRSEFEGSGVGLAICRKIVERHGGTITARSRPGEGATFIVTLPLRQPEEACSAESPFACEIAPDSARRSTQTCVRNSRDSG